MSEYETDAPDQMTIITEEYYVGYYLVGGSLRMMMSAKPNWFQRLNMRWILGWEWHGG